MVHNVAGAADDVAEMVVALGAKEAAEQRLKATERIITEVYILKYEMANMDKRR